MDNKFIACYAIGAKFGEAISGNRTQKSKMDQFFAIIGVRNEDVELEELTKNCLSVGVSCDKMLEILVDGSKDDKKLAIKEFCSGYIKGKVNSKK